MVATFIDVDKAVGNVFNNILNYKIFILSLPIKVARCSSDFLVSRAIQANENGFYLNKIHLRAEEKAMASF